MAAVHLFKDIFGQIDYFLDKNQPGMMRNRRNISLYSCKHLIESYNVQNEIDTFQLTDSDIQRDFIEVWMNIEESIRMYELTFEKQNIIKKSDKNRTIINLNLEL